MHFLCMCEAGTVRSGAMAHALKYYFGQDALACSYSKTSDETLKMLCEWADRIILLRPNFTDRISTKYKNKVKIFDVGPDVWQNPLNPELMTRVLEFCQEWQGNKWLLTETDAILAKSQ